VTNAVLLRYFNKNIESRHFYTLSNYYLNRAFTLIELNREKEVCADLLLIKDRDKKAMELLKKHCKN